MRVNSANCCEFLSLKVPFCHFLTFGILVKATVLLRCGIPESAAKKMVSVLCELRALRSSSSVFFARDGLMTLRDVFRWAKRLEKSECTDWLQCLADHGNFIRFYCDQSFLGFKTCYYLVGLILPAVYFMALLLGYFLLAARCRNKNDEEFVTRTLEKHLKRQINVEELFTLSSKYMPSNVQNMISSNIAWTYAMRRMVVLSTQAWNCDEPVLLVGETGCGKTTVAQIISQVDHDSRFF